MNWTLVCVKINEEVRPKKTDDFGILLEIFKNSAAVCSSYKILTNEVDDCQRKCCLISFRCMLSLIIFQIFQLEFEFFKNSARNSAQKSSQLCLSNIYLCPAFQKYVAGPCLTPLTKTQLSLSPLDPFIFALPLIIPFS